MNQPEPPKQECPLTPEEAHEILVVVTGAKKCLGGSC